MSEELIIREESGTSIPPHPEGQFAAKCIDIVDLGMVEQTWKGVTKKKHRGYLRFYCGEFFETEEGDERPLWVDAYFTLTLNDKGNLRPFLEAWRGKRFTYDELKGFNLAKLLGADAFIQITHNPTPERTYANITTIMRLPNGVTPAPLLDGYVRVKDRPPREEQTANNGASGYGRHDDDDDLPF